MALRALTFALCLLLTGFAAGVPLLPQQCSAADGAQTDVLDEYLSVPGSFSFVSRAPHDTIAGKVVLTVFEDFLCPRCYETASRLIPALQRKYGERLDVQYHGVPIVHAASRIPARAYAVSHELGLADEMQQALFQARFEENVDTASRDGIAIVAGRIGLDPEMLLDRLDAGGGEAELAHAIALGERYQVSAVPTLILDGWMRVNDLSSDNVETIIDGLLKRKAASHP